MWSVWYSILRRIASFHRFNALAHSFIHSLKERWKEIFFFCRSFTFLQVERVHFFSSVLICSSVHSIPFRINQIKFWNSFTNWKTTERNRDETAIIKVVRMTVVISWPRQIELNCYSLCDAAERIIDPNLGWIGCNETLPVRKSGCYARAENLDRNFKHKKKNGTKPAAI